MNKLLAYLIAIAACTASSAFAMTPEDQQEALATHNALRKLHHAPAMQWDDNLAQYAAQHASRCRFKHSHGKYGENLAAGYPTPATAIQAWYEEHNDYSYQHPGFSSATGHFTQIVWKSSTKLGCAIAACDGKNGTPGDFLVCEYSPAGNILNAGYFKKNVQ